MPSTEPLVAAVAGSGLPPDLVGPTAYLIVDAVHGAALAVGGPDERAGDLAHLRRTFEVGLGTIVAGIRARAAD